MASDGKAATAAATTAASGAATAAAAGGAAAASGTALDPDPHSLMPKVTLESAAEYWRGVSLESRRSAIDSQALAMSDNEDKSASARKNLTTITKNLKKLPTAEEKIKNFGAVLKAYQDEVDRLSQRSKFAEGSFLVLYKSLFEAPDPTPLLESAAADRLRLVRAESEAAACKQKLADYDAEFTNLKNQEYTIRKLEAENRDYELKMQKKVEELARENKRSLDDERLELRRRFAEEEQLQTVRLQAAKDSLRTALEAHDKTQQQLFDVSSRVEAAEHANDAAVASVVSAGALTDEEIRANAALVASLRKENRELKAQLAASYGSITSDAGLAPTSPASGGVSTAQLEQQITHLRSKLESQQQKESADRSELQSKLSAADGTIRQLTAAVATHRESIAAYERTIRELPTKAEVAALRQKVQVLHDMELIDKLDDDDTSSAAAAAATATAPSDASPHAAATADSPNKPSPAAASASAALIRKMRKLESDVTQLKLELSDCGAELQSTKSKLSSSLATLNESRALITKLEDDLATAGVRTTSIAIPLQSSSGAAPPPPAGAAVATASPAVTPAAQPARAGASSAAAVVADDSWGEARATDFGITAAAALITLPPSTATATAPAADSAAAATAASTASASNAVTESMLAIVCGQRDRFRKRMEALEIDKSALQTRLEAATGDAARLKADNLALYEKLQYVRSYNQSGGGGGGGTAAGGAHNQSRDVELGLAGRRSNSDDPEKRYEQLYEEKNNPFKEFKQKQRSEAYNQLSLTEKVTLNVGRLFLTRKNARSFLVFYAVLLHVLVGITIYMHTGQSHCGGGGGVGGGAGAAGGKGK